MTLAMNHLRVRLRPIQRALLGAARRTAFDIDQLAKAGTAHMGVEQVARWLGGLDRVLATGRLDGELAELTEDEVRAEAELRARGALPLDALVAGAELDRFEQDVLLVCAAVELDARFGSVLAFLQDDLQRRRPTVGLLAGLTTLFVAQLAERRRALGRLGKLRRYQLVRALPAPLEIEEELVLGPHVLEALLGTRALEPRDPLERTGAAPELPAAIDPDRIARVAEAMRAGAVGLVGVWGPARAGHEAVVRALADQLHVRVRVPGPGDDLSRAIAEAADDAAALGQLLWVDCDALARHGDALDALARTTALICLTGRQPFRSSKLLAARAYVELDLPAPSYAQRCEVWQRALPELEPARAADLAARFRIGRDELAAIARTTEATLAIGDDDADRAATVEAVASRLVRRHGQQLAREVPTHRTAADLVLAPDLHRHVLDVARAFRVWPRLRESWGLAQTGGLKALFTGDSGTGKTLAAEVIAHELGLPLVRIELAQVVSKWVGETEKNLDTVFREAEDGNAVLFFDEAEALFGKRGEVQHGTDRYANLEVSFLLQRFEDHDGLVILASNLKGEIDEAFTRRFHVVLYFPRPAEAERRRLWRLALPPSLPVADDVDLALLAKLELTGAGIVSAVRTAALRAAQSGAPQIAAADLVVGIARQFQRESRLLTVRDLGRYGEHLRAADAS